MDMRSLKSFLAQCRENGAERLRTCRSCSSYIHGPPLNKGPDDYLLKSDKCSEAFRQVVPEKKLLKSLPRYVWSTHTGCLESFNGMLLKYIPKRNAFWYDY